MADHRLPRNILPRHYKLELAPNLVAHTFDGTVVIETTVVEPTDRITCNAAELVVHEAMAVVGERRIPLSAMAASLSSPLIRPWTRPTSGST